MKISKHLTAFHSVMSGQVKSIAKKKLNLIFYGFLIVKFSSNPERGLVSAPDVQLRGRSDLQIGERGRKQGCENIKRRGCLFMSFIVG